MRDREEDQSEPPAMLPQWKQRRLRSGGRDTPPRAAAPEASSSEEHMDRLADEAPDERDGGGTPPSNVLNGGGSSRAPNAQMADTSAGADAAAAASAGLALPAIPISMTPQVEIVTDLADGSFDLPLQPQSEERAPPPAPSGDVVDEFLVRHPSSPPPVQISTHARPADGSHGFDVDNSRAVESASNGYLPQRRKTLYPAASDASGGAPGPSVADAPGKLPRRPQLTASTTRVCGSRGLSLPATRSSNVGAQQQQQQQGPKKRKAKRRRRTSDDGEVKEKRNMSAYMFFNCEHRGAISAKHNESHPGRLSKLVSAAWHRLSNEQRQVYRDRAAADRSRYHENRPPKKKRKTKKPIRTPLLDEHGNKVKKNRCAYMHYGDSVRPQVKLRHPGINASQISKIISAMYKALPEEERALWVERARQDRVRYLEAAEAAKRWHEEQKRAAGGTTNGSSGSSEHDGSDAGASDDEDHSYDDGEEDEHAYGEENEPDDAMDYSAFERRDDDHDADDHDADGAPLSWY